MMDIKLICCDVDGTLVRKDKSLSPENIYWIKRACSELGIIFVIVTGRMSHAVRYLQSQLGTSEMVSCLNGAVLYNEKHNIICNHTIPFDTQRKIIMAYERSDVDLLFISEDTWYTKSRSGYLYSKKLPIYQHESILYNFGHDDLIAANKYIAMADCKDKLLQFEREISSLLSDEGELSFYAGSDFLELMPRGINKGVAIDDLMKYYGLAKSQIMTIGDDFNDIEMLSKSGVSVAMGNAVAEVKSIAKYVTSTNEENGVARIIEQLLFD